MSTEAVSKVSLTPGNKTHPPRLATTNSSRIDTDA